MTRSKAMSFNVAAAVILGACAVAGPTGAPGGVMYAGLMSSGYTFTEYQSIMAALEHNGLVEKSGECYTLTDKGIVMNARIDRAISEHQQQRAAA